MPKVCKLVLSADFVLALALASLPRDAAAVPIHVPEDYPLVSQAIAAAVAGDTVFIALGTYGEVLTIDLGPGVVVKGSGWNMTPNPGNETRLAGMHIRFTAGTEAAVLRDVHMQDKGVTFENPHAKVIHCRFGAGHVWNDVYGAAHFANGGTLDSCVVQADFGRWGTPHSCFTIDGGTVLISNNVIDAIRADWLATVYQVSELQVRDNTIHGYALILEMFPGPQGPTTIVNNIFFGSWGIKCNGATPLVLQHNILDGIGSTSSCQPPDATNLRLDPLMCDAHWLGDVSDFALDADSPCIGAGIGGTTIGALGIACGAQTGISSDASAAAAPPVRLEITPNPVGHGGTIVIRGEVTPPFMIRAWDATGRLAAIRRFESLGEPRIDLDQLMPSRTRVSGTYFIEILAADARSAGAKLQVVR